MKPLMACATTMIAAGVVLTMASTVPKAITMTASSLALVQEEPPSQWNRALKMVLKV